MASLHAHLGGHRARCAGSSCSCSSWIKQSTWRRRTGPSSGRSRPLTVVAAAGCHYTVLGVSESATASDLKRAYRQLALKLHPDVNPTPEANERFKQVVAAYQTLSDERTRAAYDQERAAQVRRRSSMHASSSGRSSTGSYYTVYDAVVEEEEVAPDDMAGFWAWHQASSGSWQSSWRSNRHKQRQRTAAQEAASGRGGKGQRDEKQELQQLLSQLDEDTMAGLKAVFGPKLQELNSKEELVSFLTALDDLQAEYDDEWEQYLTNVRPSRGRRGRPRGSSSSSSSSTTTRTTRTSRDGRTTTTTTTYTSSSSSSSSSRSSSRSRTASSRAQGSSQGSEAGRGRPRQRRESQDPEVATHIFVPGLGWVAAAAGAAEGMSGLYEVEGNLIEVLGLENGDELIDLLTMVQDDEVW